MLMLIRALKIFTALFLLYILSSLPVGAEVIHAPGERLSSQETRRHYLQGKEFYSEGRYEEARVSFGKALDSIAPPRLITQKNQEQQKPLEISPSAKETAQETEEKEEKKKEEEEKKTEEKEEEEVGSAKVKKATPKATKIVTPSIPVVEETQGIERQYYIDVGDVLDISVWQIQDLSCRDVIVRPDGKVSFPLIGDIKAEGLTLTQLDDIITEKLKKYVKAPEVSVMIRQFSERANSVVILGEVYGPGVYKFVASPSIAEVIASAGGYTQFAVLNSIMVIRGDIRTKPEAIRVNFAQILKSANLTENILLMPNDIIYVPRSFIGKVNTFLELIQPAISEYMQTMDARHFHNVMHRN